MFRDSAGWFALQPFQVLVGRRELTNPFAQYRAAFQRRPPEGSHITVEFDHHSGRNQIFHDRREGYDGTPCERFYQDFGLRVTKPFTDMRDQPSLAAGIAERTALGDLSDVDNRNPRGRECDSCTHDRAPDTFPSPAIISI